ncbi:MAG: hypothetical protein BEN19_07795 [Epulopiscium sp. Nuni2H_MBin003]|nr:MAG: hypothetical protein BEN19_07795 [Epulopiscium sp. Nuni2H_MBin003]
MAYYYFILFLIKNKFSFFRLPVHTKAHILHKHKLYLYAGKLYYSTEEYSLALKCFKKCQSHKNVFHTYVKLNQISDALIVAEKCKYYKLGANLCMENSNFIKAAYFYSFIDPAKACELYLRCNCQFEAGLCYLSLGEYENAFNEFLKCNNPIKQRYGLLYLEEVAVVLYFRRQYEQAYNIFLSLNLFESALICAYALKKDVLIDNSEYLVTNSQNVVPLYNNLTQAT